MDILIPRPTVPTDLRITENADGERCLQYFGERIPGEVDGFEDALIGLVGVLDDEEAFGEGVLFFAGRFGTLGLCDEHRVERLSCPGHVACRPLTPEPLRLWKEEVARVREIIEIHTALDGGGIPSPPGRDTPSGESGVSQKADRWLLRVEKVEQALRSVGAGDATWLDGQRAVTQEYEEKALAAEGELRDLSTRLAQLMPATAGEWRNYLGELLNDGLMRYPPAVRVVGGQQGLRTCLVPEGVFSRAYLLTAHLVAMPPRWFTCSECAQPYTPQRRPKRGQWNYCPACRRSGAARRRSERKALSPRSHHGARKRPLPEEGPTP